MQRFSVKRLVVAFALVGVVLAVVLGLSQRFAGAGDDSQGDSGYGPLTSGPARLGEPAPDFVLEDLSGHPVQLSSFRGKTVLINFWASWCVPCRREMPDMEDVYEQTKASGVVILALNQREPREQATSFIEKYGVTFPVLLDTQAAVSKAYRTSGLPESWVVDPQGTLRDHQIGPYTSSRLKESLSTVPPAQGKD